MTTTDTTTPTTTIIPTVPVTPTTPTVPEIYEVCEVMRMSKGVHGMEARLGIGPCPGRKSSSGKRCLFTDLSRIVNAGYRDIVCMLEWKELAQIGLSHYVLHAQEQGCNVYHLPVRDGRAPAIEHAEPVCTIIQSLLHRGRSVLVHCRAGLGRSGTICACVLVDLGWTFTDAMAHVRLKRPGAIQHRNQELMIRKYATRHVIDVAATGTTSTGTVDTGTVATGTSSTRDTTTPVATNTPVATDTQANTSEDSTSHNETTVSYAIDSPIITITQAIEQSST